jgi:hypothetical protein
MKRALVIAVAGPGDASGAELAIAEEVGAALAAAGCVVVTGGLGGVMEAASRGARSKLGSTIGILPGSDPDEANGWVELPIPTGLGEGRNALVVAAAAGLIAVGGGYGTLAEVALALRRGKPVVGIASWDVPGVEVAADAAVAVARIAALTS